MSKHRFQIIEPAELELQDIFEYYETESQNLGRRFIREFRRGIKRILQFPYAWPTIESNVRKCTLKKFPFHIIYAVTDELIMILAIAHHRRKPDYWIDRLK